jgi:hypothetical protein
MTITGIAHARWQPSRLLDQRLACGMSVGSSTNQAGNDHLDDGSNLLSLEAFRLIASKDSMGRSNEHESGRPVSEVRATVAAEHLRVLRASGTSQ